MLCSEPASNDHFQTQTGAALCYVSCTVTDYLRLLAQAGAFAPHGLPAISPRNHPGKEIQGKISGSGIERGKIRGRFQDQGCRSAPGLFPRGFQFFVPVFVHRPHAFKAVSA